jgi:hypothetical protein
MTSFAHIAGMPVEETIGSLGPALLLTFGAASATLRARLRRARSSARRGWQVQEGFIGRKSVVNGCRIRVLGGEPLVDGDDLGVRPPADVRGQVSGEEGDRGS